MSFEKFTHKHYGRHRANKPIISLYNEVIVFNSACISEYSLKDYKYINLYYDKKANKIGFEPTNEPDKNSYVLTRERSAVKVGVQAFTAYYNISLPEESTKYRPKLVDDMLVITLGDE